MTKSIILGERELCVRKKDHALIILQHEFFDPYLKDDLEKLNIFKEKNNKNLL